MCNNRLHGIEAKGAPDGLAREERSNLLNPIFCSLKGLFDASELRKQPLFL